MNILFELEDKNYGTSNVSRDSNTISLFYPCNSHSSCTNYVSSFPAGIYIFEVWGCSGGHNSSRGGYSKGTVSLRRKTKIHIFIGSEGDSLIGTQGFTQPSFNGGGHGYSAHSISNYRSTSSGGGSTDIRFNGASLYHRVLVAGGGGGGATTSYSAQLIGGDGGGEKGFKVASHEHYGEGANQTSPGIGEFDFNSTGVGRFSGIFGHGGQGNQESTNGGGGGGWYGGSSGFAGHSRSGGGGSGYVLNQTSFKPEGYLVDDSKYYFNDSSVLSGKDSFPSCFDDQTEKIGHIGNGCARITVLFSSDELEITCQKSYLVLNYFSMFSIFGSCFIIN